MVKVKNAPPPTATILAAIIGIRAEGIVRLTSYPTSRYIDLLRKTCVIRGICRKLCEDNALGKLTDEEYFQYSADYKQEQADISKRLEELNALLSEQKAEIDNSSKFAAVAGKYLDSTNI